MRVWVILALIPAALPCVAHMGLSGSAMNGAHQARSCRNPNSPIKLPSKSRAYRGRAGIGAAICAEAGIILSLATEAALVPSPLVAVTVKV